MIRKVEVKIGLDGAKKTIIGEDMSKVIAEVDSFLAGL